MRVIKHNGREIRIREDDWRKMTERFDVGRAAYDSLSGYYCIYVDCPLCNRYSRTIIEGGCGKCPLRIFERLDELGRLNEVGCGIVVKEILAEHNFDKLYFDISGGSLVEWKQVDDPTARDQIRVIQNKLLSMKKEE